MPNIFKQVAGLLRRTNRKAIKKQGRGAQQAGQLQSAYNNRGSTIQTALSGAVARNNYSSMGSTGSSGF